jgi:hypothetical protein
MTRSLPAALAAVVVIASGCDSLLTEPAKAPAEVAVSLSLGSAAAGRAAAYDKADTIRMALFTPATLRSIDLQSINRSNVESVILNAAVALLKSPFSPSAENRVRLEIPENLDSVGIAIALMQTGRPLFLGIGFTVKERGSVTPLPVTLFPVPDRVVTRAMPTFRTIGQTALLGPEVVFVTNDTIDGYTFTYQSSNTRVATVNSSGQVTAVGAGTANITVTARDLTFVLNHTVTVTVTPATAALQVLPQQRQTQEPNAATLRISSRHSTS